MNNIKSCVVSHLGKLHLQQNNIHSRSCGTQLTTQFSSAVRDDGNSNHDEVTNDNYMMVHFGPDGDKGLSLRRLTL